MGDTLKAILYMVVLALIGWNIYTGATVQKVGIPGVFEITFGSTEEPKDNKPAVDEPPVDDGSKLASVYLMDNLAHRRIVITHFGGNEYRVEEPSGSWPWEGRATLDGGVFWGEASFSDSLGSMKLDGVLRGDGTIKIDYVFITSGDGSPAEGRVDSHIWYPE